MHWMLLSLLSALILGFYALAKKSAVHKNAVPPVLLLNVLTAAAIYLPVIVISRISPDSLNQTLLFVEPMSLQQHMMLFCKATIVGASWALAFHGLKHLPLSIATPIRSTSPLWTIAVAVVFFAERPALVQWLGILTILTAFLTFSFVGQKEGIEFRSNRWVGMMLAATLLGSISALYDKYLLQQLQFRPATVQAWFSIYLVVVLLPMAIHWYFKERIRKPFEFRWSIPAIALTLLVADFLYFTAITDPQAQISIISPLRRTSVLIPFLHGVINLNEKNARPKAICVGVMLIGVYLIR